jgi:hypothetical protein
MNFFRVTTFFKVTNAEETHYGYSYHDGLNELNEKFQERGSCIAGGFYFTTAEHISKHFYRGIYLREVILPVQDPTFKVVCDDNDKWRANKIILGKRYSLFDPLTYKIFGLDPTENIYLTRQALEIGNADFLKSHLKNETTIIFHGKEKRLAKHCIPPNITHLYFGYDYNHPIDDSIPNTVTHVIFGRRFNQPILGCIPYGVTHLTFGADFDQPIKGCIPTSVTHLIFGYCFNQSIIGCIPNGVTHVTFSRCFRQGLEYLPKSVTHLTLDSQALRSMLETIPKFVIDVQYYDCIFHEYLKRDQ